MHYQKSSGSLRSLAPSSQSSSSQRGGQECIQVCIRLRPLLRPQEDEEAWSISKKISSIYSIVDQTRSLRATATGDTPDGMSVKDRKRLLEAGSNSISFSFDNLEDSEARTQTIYNKIGKQIVISSLDGYHGSILCYGQTTSGKTFTMLGSPENPGVLPCAVRDIFGMIASRGVSEEFSVWVSYMEIYNENINDLLSPSSTNLKIVDDSKWGTIVQGLKMQRVWTFEQAIVLMNYGEEHRIYRETSISEHSSRSHTVFKIVFLFNGIINKQMDAFLVEFLMVFVQLLKYIESYRKDLKEGYKNTRYSSLNLVDLAGSERLSETDNITNTLSETGYINKSLFVLANCINKLAEGKKQHIPYRDSKLTRILCQALGGNSLTTIICCVSPAVCNFNQTLSTLRFATRAKVIQNKPILNEIGHMQNDLTNESLVSQEDYRKLEENLEIVTIQEREGRRVKECIK